MTSLYTVNSRAVVHGGHGRAVLLRRRSYIIGLAVLSLMLICLSARDGLLNLYDRWRFEDEYGYGFLVAALAPILVWRAWKGIVGSVGATSLPGLTILVLAQVTVVLAALGESYFLEQLALVVSVMAIGLIVFGAGAIRLLLPIGLLLLLTIPWPYTLQAMATIDLQLVSTDIGVAIIQLLGIPVYADGNIIDLGVYKLQVAEACSGLRYLLPLTCLAVLIAYLFKAPLWKRATVVIMATPITILINSIRIAATAVLVANFGSAMAEGFLHAFEGWVVFVAGLLLLTLIVFALQGFQRSKVEIESILDRLPAPHRISGPINATIALFVAAAVCASAFAITTAIARGYQSTPEPIREGFAQFPRNLDRWSGQPGQLDPQIADSLKATDYYIGDFAEGAGDPGVNLFVAYYKSLAKGAAIHSPRVCLPGSGWEFSSFKERRFDDMASGVAGTYYDVVIQKGEHKILMYYWYQQGLRRTANEFGMKYYLLLDNLFTGRKDGALIRLYTPIEGSSGERGEAEAAARLRNFAHAMFPRMADFLPR